MKTTGVIARTDEASSATHQVAAATAHFTLRFPPHQDNCFSCADGAPMHPTGITAYAFFHNGKSANPIVVDPLHPSWRELLPPQSTTITLGTWRYLGGSTQLAWRRESGEVGAMVGRARWRGGATVQPVGWGSRSAWAAETWSEPT